jgi:hypothetical protein
MRHARAFRGPGRSTIKFCNLIGVCFPGRAVKGRKFGDQLGDGHPELGCSGLEHIRGVLVDLDADAGVHGTRIADPETVGSIPARPTTAVRFPSAVIAIVDRKLLRGCPGCSRSRGIRRPRRDAGFRRRAETLRVLRRQLLADGRRAVLRRASSGGEDHGDVYRFGDTEIDFGRAEVRRGGTVVDLSAIEFKLLSTFVKGRGRLFTRDQLLDAVWGLFFLYLSLPPL